MAPNNRSGRGFAGMPSQERRRLAAMGGRASHESGHGHEWSTDEAREYGRQGGLASHHHERAAFHHETAAHHHQRAASHRATGNHSRANLHAESAYDHERRAGDHAEQAFHHGRAREQDERDASSDRQTSSDRDREVSNDRDRDAQGRFQSSRESSNEDRQGGYRETGSDYRGETRGETPDRGEYGDTRRTSNARNDSIDDEIEPRRNSDRGGADRRSDQDYGAVNGRSESNGNARENS